MIISFAMTPEALLAGAKTVTRRAWKERTALTVHAGMLVNAWDKSPRQGGRHIANIVITHEPYREWLRNFPQEDWEAEGFGFYERHPELGHRTIRDALDIWGRAHLDRTLQAIYGDLNRQIWVVRFKLESIVGEKVAA